MSEFSVSKTYIWFISMSDTKKNENKLIKKRQNSTFEVTIHHSKDKTFVLLLHLQK